MPQPKHSEKLLRRTIEAYIEKGAIHLAAKRLRVPVATYRTRLERAIGELGTEYGVAPIGQGKPTKNAAAFALPALPTGRRPVEELVAERKAKTAEHIRASKARELIRVPVKQAGPIGLALIGDPHVDDDGSDLSRLEADLHVIAGNQAMHAVHVGDVTNNWVGRLAALYAHQSTSAADAAELAEWMFRLAPPLIVVQGNHDLWPGENHRLIDHLMRGADALVGKHGVRVAFEFPGGLIYRAHIRHDFPGKSQFSDTHGMKRETLFGYRDHLLVAGHTHVDEARVVPINTEGIVSTFVRVSGYKIADDYADGNRFLPKRMAPSVLAVVNPDAKVAAETTKLFWDLEAGSDYLTWLRQPRRKRA